VRGVGAAAFAAAAATAGLAIALALLPGHREEALDAWLLALGAVALATLVAATRRLEERLEPLVPVRSVDREAPSGIPELERIDRVLVLAAASGFDVHYRVRPLLRQLAVDRLARRGVDLDRQPDTARALLGDELWDLVRPERLISDAERQGRGLSPTEIGRLVDAVEAV
jgi:HAMP domain-containing protein